MLKTKRELATAFGVSLTSAQNWTARTDFPGGAKGPWENSLVETYLRQNGLWKYSRTIPAQDRLADDEGEQGDEAESLLVQKLRAEIRKLRLDADGKEIRNDKAAGEVINRQEAMQAISELLVGIGTMLDSLADELRLSFPEETREQNVADVKHKVWLKKKEMAAWRL